MKKTILSFLFILSFSFSGLCTHIMGGEIIAEGEISGHKHKIFGSAQVNIRPSFVNRPINENSEIWFNAFDEIKLEHEEHKTLEIPKGVYKVTKEQQFDPFQGITQRMVD